MSAAGRSPADSFGRLVILLASRSPQRRALLGLLDVPFRAVPSRFEEGEGALENARGKAREVAGRLGVPAGGAVLGSDTEVVVDDRVLGKPADAGEARAMLGLLSGRAHEVRSAVALVTADGERSALSRTAVWFRALGPAEVDWYLARGEWPDRAGGYAIQGAGAALVARIEGDHGTVVGLPLPALAELLTACGLAPWCGADAGHRTASRPRQ